MALCIDGQEYSQRTEDGSQDEPPEAIVLPAAQDDAKHEADGQPPAADGYHEYDVVGH